MANNIPVITIDGTSGTGKGTLSLILSRQLQWHFLDSGALYRALALAAQQRNIQEDNISVLSALGAQLDVYFDADKIMLEGKDATEAIRTPACSSAASRISAHLPVRAALLDRQRAFRLPPGLVADGRDMGTVVFPDAVFKIFMTASAEVRALRRYKQLQEKLISVSLDEVLTELLERDKRDMERQIAPLKPAADAWVIDTTTLSIDEAFSDIINRMKTVGCFV